VLLILGNGGEAIAEAAGIASLNLGYVSSDHLKSIAYCADLFIFPTRADNLPLVLQEIWPVVRRWSLSKLVASLIWYVQALPVT